MGVQAIFHFSTGGVPGWETIRAKIAETGESPVVRMIDGLPAFPDEVPPETWREIRVGLNGAMVTLRRSGDEIEVVTWGTADETLEAARNRVGLALREISEPEGSRMTAKDLILRALEASREQFKMFLSDLSDADLLVRPVPGANHIAWQFGHVLCSELRLIRGLSGDQGPILPAGFEEAHAKDRASADTGFSDRATYLAVLDKVRNATIACVKALPDADLDKPNPGPTAKRWPLVADLCLLVAAFHPTIHTGQFTVVRRKLGKPILF